MALKSTSKKTRKPATASKPVAPVRPGAKKTPVTKAAAPAVAPRAATPAQSKSAPAAPVDKTQKITLTFFAPEAASVSVAGDFTQWENSPVSLVKEQTGLWRTTLALKPGKYQYRLLVDGQWQNDPQCQELQPNDFGSVNCVLCVAA